MGTWFVTGFCTGLRGEEMLLIELSGMMKGLENLKKREPYFKLMITGTTKGNQLSAARFGIPCVMVTGGTYL